MNKAKEIVKEYKNEDPLCLQNSDFPDMILVTPPLTGLNYLSWSRSFKVALEVK